MESLIYILTFFLGCTLGGVMAWLVAKSKISARLSSALSQSQTEIARLQEVIQGKGKELQDRNSRIADLQGALSRADASILKISEERSAAKAKLEQMNQVQQALDEGMFAFVEKPFTFEELTAKVRTATKA